MPKIELIAVDAIPTSPSARVSHALHTELTGALREALHKNQALTLRLSPSERPSRFSKILKAAADELGVGVIISGGEPRTRINACGREIMEASILYARITKSKRAAPTPPQPRMIDDQGRRPIITAPAAFEKTLLPGVEVSR